MSDPASWTAGAPSDPELRSLLEEMIHRGASDLHLTVGERPKLRIDGELHDAGVESALLPRHTTAFTREVLDDEQWDRFRADHDLDTSFGVSKLARFRVNAFYQRGHPALVLRAIPHEIRPLRELGLPSVVSELAERPRGLVLVTGPTGSGKSTTLAGMIDEINRQRRCHIVTIEDPFEYLHRHKRSLVNQREVGADTRSFATALKYVLRQDPDVILVGEMRDLETIQAALTVSETGHLTLATLHTNSAAESINRIVDVFPAHEQPRVRQQLAFVLEGVITQTLLPRDGALGRALACEILVVTPAVRCLIREDKVHQIYSAMQAGKKHGMQTLNDDLYRLYAAGEVTLETCLRVSGDPEGFRRILGDAPAVVSGKA